MGHSPHEGSEPLPTVPSGSQSPLKPCPLSPMGHSPHSGPTARGGPEVVRGAGIWPFSSSAAALPGFGAVAWEGRSHGALAVTRNPPPPQVTVSPMVTTHLVTPNPPHLLSVGPHSSGYLQSSGFPMGRAGSRRGLASSLGFVPRGPHGVTNWLCPGLTLGGEGTLRGGG